MATQRSSTAVTVALRLTEMVLFGVGPGGAVAGATAGLVGLLFGAEPDGSAPTLDMPAVVDDIVDRSLDDRDIRDAATSILVYSTWLGDQLSLVRTEDPNWAAHAGDWDDIEQHLRDAVGPNSPLLHAIGTLTGRFDESKSFTLDGFAPFLLGASLHLVFLRALVLISTSGTSFRSPKTHELASVAARYLDYASRVDGYVHGQFDDRLGGIDGPVFVDVGTIDQHGREQMQTFAAIVDTKFDVTPTRPNTLQFWSCIGFICLPPVLPSRFSAPNGKRYLGQPIVAYRPARQLGAPPDAGVIAEATADRDRYIGAVSWDLTLTYQYSLARQHEVNQFLAELHQVRDSFAGLSPS